MARCTAPNSVISASRMCSSDLPNDQRYGAGFQFHCASLKFSMWERHSASESRSSWITRARSSADIEALEAHNLDAGRRSPARSRERVVMEFSSWSRNFLLVRRNNEWVGGKSTRAHEAGFPPLRQAQSSG